MFEKSLIMELVHGVSVDNNVCTAEKKISINFTKANTKCFFSLHYNGYESYLYVNNNGSENYLFVNKTDLQI